MHNFDLSADNALEFPNLPYRTRDHTSSLLDSSEFEVGKDFSNKDSFLGALKQHSINNDVNYHVVKSKSDKFEAKCAVQDGSCSWKIYASLRKRTGLWEIKKYKGPHTCAAGISQDHPKMDSAMLASLILPTVKADLRTSVLVLIANIRNQMGYTPSYRKAWIAKQKALEKMHSGWDASYNEIWQWCQVLERYVLGCITDLQIEPAYYSDRLLRRCQVFKRLFWSFKQCRDAFAYCKPLDGSGRILPIAFAITPGESADDWDFFLSRLRRHVFPQPNICVISDRGTGILAAIARQGTCQNLRLDPMSYVDDVYKLEYMYNMWRHIFPLVPNERKWPSVLLAPFKLLPDRELRRKPKGRPCSTRICNNMDIQETTNQQKLCGWCRNPGHTSRSCPNRNS
ncbi:uncharacterized protein LOC128295399 [Gossypium arboreum]|uniref:uncharacterized protein LOC128295399 n=1 Tax=Gossypium arboreum TaxID=29729 RepID=UPI0022F1BEA4|nr:uncharacterized protein LOC128295399 [Gossypium arboreum]